MGKWEHLFLARPLWIPDNKTEQNELCVSWRAQYFLSLSILAYLCCDQRNKISFKKKKKKKHFKEDKPAHQEPEATLQVQGDDQMA